MKVEIFLLLGDGKKNEKFRRLMGIKSNVPPKAVPVAAAPSAVLSPEEQVDSISMKNVAKKFYENFNDIVQGDFFNWPPP